MKVKYILAALIACVGLAFAGLAIAGVRPATKGKPHIVTKIVHRWCYFVDKRSGETYADVSLSPSQAQPDTSLPARIGRKHGVIVQRCLKQRPGKNGAAGATGANGVNGAAGANGVNGSAGATGAQGIAGEAGAPGESGGIGATGPAGAVGATGAQGATGATGPAGADGKDGSDGLGNGTAYLCVSNGENVKYGGTDGSLCDPGHDTLVKIVTVTP